MAPHQSAGARGCPPSRSGNRTPFDEEVPPESDKRRRLTEGGEGRTEQGRGGDRKGWTGDGRKEREGSRVECRGRDGRGGEEREREAG